MSFLIARILVHFLWQGVVLAAVLFLLLRVLRTPNARYNACAAALALMCAAPVATFFYLSPSMAAGNAPRGVVLPTALPVAGAASAGWLEANAPWLAWLWLAGALLLMLRSVLSWWRARGVVTHDFQPLDGKLEAAAVSLAARVGATGVRFRVSARVASALVFGWLKPVVVLPAAALGRLTGAEIEALLAHELAHVVRRDFLVNLLQTAAECVLFYHPLVWWVSARMREERELCCDDFAVALCRDEVLYSKALLRLEELRMEPALAATGGRLALRIRRLLNRPDPDRIAVAPALAFVLVFGISVALLAQTPPPAPPTPPTAPAAPVTAQQIYRLEDGVTAPRPIYRVEPAYTPQARAAHVQGQSVLAVIISPEGRVTDVRVMKSLDQGLDQKAVEAVRAWKFEPGRKDGKAVPVAATIETNFQLLDTPPAPPVAMIAPAAPGAPPALHAAPVPLVAPEPPDPPQELTEKEQAAVEAKLAARLQANMERKEAAREAHAAADAEALEAKAAAREKQLAQTEAQWAEREESRMQAEAAAREKQLAQTEAQWAEREEGRRQATAAAREKQLAQTEAQWAKREESRMQAKADAMRQEAAAKETELQRRKAYAAKRFGGEDTGRGKAYIHYGPPDEIESHPSTGTENWRYKNATKDKVTLELNFKDGKLVRSTGGASAK